MIKMDVLVAVKIINSFMSVLFSSTLIYIWYQIWKTLQLNNHELNKMTEHLNRLDRTVNYHGEMVERLVRKQSK